MIKIYTLFLTKIALKSNLANLVAFFFSIVLDRVQNALRLPNYPRLDKIPLPPHLQKARDAGKKARLLASTPSSQRETTVVVN